MKKERIPGGKSKGKSLRDIAIMHCKSDSKNSPDEIKVEKMLNHLKLEFKKGIKTELEHTTDKNIAREIAMDHLYEDPKYYTKLSKIEEGFDFDNKKEKITETIRKVIRQYLNENKVYTNKEEYEKAMKEYNSLYKVYKDCINFYNYLKTVKLPVIRYQTGFEGLCPDFEGTYNSPIATEIRKKGNKIFEKTSQIKQSKKLKIKKEYSIHFALLYGDWVPCPEFKGPGGQCRCGNKKDIYYTPIETLKDVEIDRKKYDSLWWVNGIIFEKPKKPILQELPSPKPLVTPPQPKTISKQEPKEIRVGDIIMSKGEFIKMYGQSVWDKYTK